MTTSLQEHLVDRYGADIIAQTFSLRPTLNHTDKQSNRINEIGQPKDLRSKHRCSEWRFSFLDEVLANEMFGNQNIF